MKYWKKYIVYAIFIFTFLVFLIFLNNKISIKKNPPSNMYILWLKMFVFNFFFGIVLGIEHLLKEKGKDGDWVFNLPRIVILGIPSLIMGLYHFIYYTNVQIIVTLTGYLPGFLLQSSLFIELNQIFLGYVLSTNFSKVKNEFKEEH